MLLIIIGATFQGAANAVVGLTVGPGSIFLFLGCAFLIASITGTFLRAVGPAVKTRIRRKDIVALNLATAVTFGAFYLSLIWIPASLAAGAEAASAPLAALALANVKHGRPRAQLWLIALTIFLISVIFGWSQQMAGATAPGFGTLIGMVLGFIAGIGLAVLATISRRLAGDGVSAYSILAVRYHATYLLAFACAFMSWKESPTAALTGSSVIWLVLLGFAAVALPLVLIQSGMMKTSATITSVIMASVPGISFITESFIAPHNSSITSWGLLIALIIAVCFYGRAEHRISQHEGNDQSGVVAHPSTRIAPKQAP